MGDGADDALDRAENDCLLAMERGQRPLVKWAAQKVNSIKIGSQTAKADPFDFDDAPQEGSAATLGNTFTAAVTGIIFHNDENGYCVLAVTAGKGRDAQDTRCVGNLPERPTEGLQYEFTGEWTSHAKYGRQFQFTTARQVMPSDEAGLVRYLGSGVIKGIGDSLARAIVKHYGAETVAVLDQCEARLLAAVAGIGRVKAAAIVEQWAEKVKYREQSVKLMSLGISANLCVKIIKHFERELQDPWEGVREDPYCLTELWGVGFKTADGIGRQMGIGLKDPRRLRAATVYTLQQARDGEGHCFLGHSEVVDRVANVCNVDAETVERYLLDADGDLRLVRSVQTELAATPEALFAEKTYWLAGLHRDETRLAECLQKCAEAVPTPRAWMDTSALQAAFADKAGYHLTAEQLEAVYALLGTALGVLTGGPGVGKTAVSRALVLLAEAAGMRVGLASPTGRAAKRLEEMTGHEARTLHRLLGWSQGDQGFLHNADEPLDYDVVVVDEASMVDVSLARSLLEAIRPGRTRLIFVGDKDQLPSVGPGSVLNDVIASQRATVRELTQIMRQAEGSGIVADAHRVNHGRQPELATADCTFVERDDPEQARRAILALATEARGTRVVYERQGGWSVPVDTVGARETQILTPMRKGPLGTMELNRMLQEALNPPRQGVPELAVGRAETARTYRLRDRVIQTRNDYDRGVMNGDIGEVTAVDTAAGEVTIRFAETTAVYGRKDLKEVDLAYALTIHKSQGSEYQQVVVVCHWSHYVMLQRNLLYTALTRGREQAVVVGEQRAVGRCVSNNRPARRNTRLTERLTEKAGVA